MRTASLWLALVATAAGAAQGATDRLWLIGGGPDVFGSQVQIETNVVWAQRAAAGFPGARSLRTWFTDGSGPEPDIVEWAPPPDAPESLQPLARVMDSYWSNGERYRNHRVPGVVGGTEAGRLYDDLSEALLGMEPADRAWLVFIGHGSLDEDLNNSIELWNNTRLRVSDLQALLDLAPASARIRFLFAQCYSGAFTALARPGTRRCGFVAEAADREAEGCSAAIDQTGYQDYSSHFFAGLAGVGRDGTATDPTADRDGDGRVSPLEAHYHTLVSARSADIPRATSDALLEQWQPWYLPAALVFFSGADNIYARLARTLAGQAAPAQDPRGRRRALQAQRRDLERAQEALSRENAVLRERIETEVLRRWPEAAYAYTLNYRRFLQRDLTRAQGFILSHPDYPGLKLGQDRYWVLEDEILHVEREYSRLEKIEHLQDLARRRAALDTLGPEELRSRYRDLLECEATPF